MRLNSTMSQEEVATALRQAAVETWGPERLDGMRGVIEQAARAIWAVLQAPLAPLSEEPDLPALEGGHERRP